MILFGLALAAVVLVGVWRSLERLAYLKMGEAYDKELARRREWKVGIPYDPTRRGRR